MAKLQYSHILKLAHGNSAHKDKEIKMATFYNQATLTYGANTVNSNTTEAELLSGLNITKTAITAGYVAGGNIVYAVTISNMGGSSYPALTVNDNLGAYTLPSGGTAVPLDYVDGSILYYLNGVLQPAPTVNANGNLTISGINLPQGSTATFIYEVTANEFAPISDGSTIVNTASVNGGACDDEISASATVTVITSPRLTIAKAVSPAVITDNGQLTYTLIIQNLGNTPIVATDGVIVRDLFNPILSDITVTLNGEELAEGIGYTYGEQSGAFATTNGTVTVPAATYTQNPITGAITTTPGVSIITVTGTI